MARRSRPSVTRCRTYLPTGEGMPRKRELNNNHSAPVSLKFLAKHLDLSPATISVVLNDSPTAQEIPQHTKDRIFARPRSSTTVQMSGHALCETSVAMPLEFSYLRSARAM